MYVRTQTSRLGVAPAVAVAAQYTASQVVPSILSSIFGSSEGFRQRQATSDQFFALRNRIFELEPFMTPDQYAAWRSLSLHRADYNTRRETAIERAELQDFVQRLGDPSAWPQPSQPSPVPMPGLTTTPQTLQPSQPIQASLFQPKVLVPVAIGFGLLAYALFRK